ncbi:MAG: pyocin knob domain-containing protein [Vampirovibrionales bacterium]
MMAPINRLRQATIQNGQLINADDLNIEFDQLVNKANEADALLTLDATLTGVKTFANGFIANGTVSFPGVGLGSTNAPVYGTDLNTYRASGLYRTNASTTNIPVTGRFYTVLHMVGDVQQVATQLATETNNAGNVFIRQSTVAGGWGAWRQLATQLFALGDSIRGQAPTYLNTTSVTMAAGLQCLDSLRTTLISVTNATTLNLASTGLNGLDAGSLASNTWYFIHAILNPTTGATGYVASTSSTSPTLPSGFTIRRLLPFTLRTEVSTATLVAFIMSHSLHTVQTRWFFAGTSELIFSVPGIGSATAYVVDASLAVPPICNGSNSRLILSLIQDTGQQNLFSRISFDNTATGNWQAASAQAWVAQTTHEIPLYASSRQFRLRNDASGGGAAVCNCEVYARGYVFNYLGVV